MSSPKSEASTVCGSTEPVLSPWSSGPRTEGVVEGLAEVSAESPVAVVSPDGVDERVTVAILIVAAVLVGELISVAAGVLVGRLTAIGVRVGVAAGVEVGVLVGLGGAVAVGKGR